MNNVIKVNEEGLLILFFGKNVVHFFKTIFGIKESLLSCNTFDEFSGILFVNKLS